MVFAKAPAEVAAVAFGSGARVAWMTVGRGVATSPSTVLVGGSQPATTDIKASIAKTAFRTARGIDLMVGEDEAMRETPLLRSPPCGIGMLTLLQVFHPTSSQQGGAKPHPSANRLIRDHGRRA